MDKGKKKRLKRIITWTGIAALVALLAVMPLLAKQEAQADGPVASILSAQVARGDVPQVLRGGGTLEDRGEQEVNLPAGVKITEFLVKNGDAVKAGDPVAMVDTVSVMAAITDVADTMDYLREELEKGRNEKVDSTITATAGGRVKEIFAWAGESVQDVMLRRGALALLSIDGLMAVKLEVVSPVTTGESVSVRVNGGEVTGRVESNLSGAVTVTVEDEGYAIGESVTVTCADGTVLGKGELYVHNAWKAVAYSGTVSNVHVRKEQILSSGAALFTLTDTDYEGQLRRRASQHREYEELLQRLLVMYESGCLTAPCDGLVSGVDEDSVHLLSAVEEGAQAKLLDGGGMGTVRLMLLSNIQGCKEGVFTNPNCSAGAGKHEDACVRDACVPGSACEAKNHASNCIAGCTGDSSCGNVAGFHQAGCYQCCTEAEKPEDCPNPDGGKHKGNCIKSCTRGTAEAGTGECGSKNGTHHYGDCIESCQNKSSLADCPATKKHKSGCIGACTSESALNQCKAAPYHKYDCIESCVPGPNCLASKHKDGCALKQMTFTGRVGKVDYVGNTVVGVFWDNNTYPVMNVNGKWQIASQDFTGNAYLTLGEISVDDPKSFKKGDVILAITGYENNQAVWSRTVKYASGGGAQQAPMGGADFDMGQLGELSGMMGGFSGYGNFSSAAAAEAETLHDLKGNSLLAVTPEEGVRVEILLDERDISKVREGMEATIKVEALNGQSFSGKVTRVGAIGEHSGSTGKFAVEVQTDTIPGSLPGMSSKVTIHRQTKENVLTLPVAALVQEGAKTLVYTALDAKTGQPTAPREITTGVSDGENVEVFGLEEGMTVYYLYYDVLELDHTARERQFNLN